MDIRNFIFFVVLSLSGVVFSDEAFYQSRACCLFRGPHWEDIEYTIKYIYNKKVIMDYNSTRSSWIGNTAYAADLAQHWSKDPFDALQRQFEKTTLCLDNIKYIQDLDNLTAAPTIKLNSVEHPSMLVCSVYNFYPKQILVTWLRNGQEVTSDVSFSEVLPDGDWYYQIHSYLEYNPSRQSQQIACMVEHLSLSEPMLQIWDASLPAAERNKIVVGLCGLMLGFVFVISGFIYYKKKSAAYFTLCQGRVSIPVEHLAAADAT